jgi:site-specific DNA-methyltransferase (adenine-specific)
MIIEGDCIEKLKELEENSVDFLLTDPPYGINFMAKKWDKFSNSQKYQKWTEEWAREVLRVLKPGALGLVFGDTRLHHRIMCGLEDAGFEIRDTIMWLFLSGFPKGQDISKFIDKHFGLKRERGAEKVYADGGKASARKKVGDPLTKTVYAEKGKNIAGEGVVYETIPVAPEAQVWAGYRTGLKPAYEPIILIQKPRQGTFVQNVLKWGVGGLNVDGCRIPINIEHESDPRAHDQSKNVKRTFEHQNAAVDFFGKNGVRAEHIQQLYEMKGRYPTNVIIDEMVAELMNMISGIKKAGKTVLHQEVDRKGPDAATWNKDNCGFKAPTEGVSNYGDQGGMSKYFKNVDTWVEPLKTVYGGKGFKRSFEHFNLRDGGGMGRFFYCPKASTKERETGLENIETRVRDTSRKGDPANPYNRNHKVKNFHPTVKPIKLLTYLIRMIRPPTKNPVMLDPFAGSGSSAIASKIEGCNYILIEKNPDYIPIIEGRLSVDIAEFQDFTDNDVTLKEEPDFKDYFNSFF